MTTHAQLGQGSAPTALAATRAYVAAGYRVVPCGWKTKKPSLPNWPALRLDEAGLVQYFSKPTNIGILLGEPSGWLVDVDLDCPEAVEMAGQYLPATPAITGHAGRPGSHWWFRSQNATTTKHHDPATRAMLVEIRSTGAQTVVGPGTHPDGGAYEVLTGQPAVVPFEELSAAVARLVAAILERRHGPKATTVAQPRPLSNALAIHDHDQARRDERRAIAYLDGIPGAVSGSGGHAQTYAAATALVHGFGLPMDTALDLLLARYNPRCDPPWTEKELRHKVEDAASKRHDRPFRWLADAGQKEDSGVDLSKFVIGSKLAPSPTPTGPLATPDPGPFPRNLLHVPGFVGEVAAWMESCAHRSQPVLSLAAALSLQAVLAGRKVKDAMGNRTNIYSIGVARSGMGKDHARQMIKRILFEAGLDNLEGEEDVASDSGLFTSVAEQPAILFQFDEFGRFLLTIGDPKKAPHLFGVVTALLKMYSCAGSVFRGKAYADKKRNRVIHQPCVSMYSTTVAESFYASMTAESLSDGFVARLLVFEGDNAPDLRFPTELPVPRSIVEQAIFWKNFQPGGNLARATGDPALVPTTAEAKELFEACGAEWDKPGKANVPGSAVFNRAGEKARRLALVYACSACAEEPYIDTAAAGWACELVDYMTRRIVHLASEWISEGPFDAAQKRAIRALRDAGGSMRRFELTTALRHMRPRDRDEVIANLIETGQMIERFEPTSGPGRPARVYELPGLTDLEKKEAL